MKSTFSVYKAYLGPSKTTTIAGFAEIVVYKRFQPLTIFTKNSIIDN